MGTTLTGTTPQDTYDALIKVGDNGIITGSLKTLSDGEGHDTALALSTGGASVTGTLAVSSDVFIADKIVHTGDTNTAIRFPAADTITFETSGAEAARITSAGNVLISATAPVGSRNELRLGGNSAGSAITMGRLGINVFTIQNDSGDNVSFENSANTFMSFVTNNTEKLRILAGGGITFNGDTAAANALDDYEEGTWTMGVSFGGAAVGVTTLFNTGKYTKIGRQVTVNGWLFLTNKGSSTGIAAITGLPFTIFNSSQNYSAASLYISSITFANQVQAFGDSGTTNITLEEITEAGVNTSLTNADFSDSSNIMVSLTYFV